MLWDVRVALVVAGTIGSPEFIVVFCLCYDIVDFLNSQPVNMVMCCVKQSMKHGYVFLVVFFSAAGRGNYFRVTKRTTRIDDYL